jgi:hypothetical protein
MTTVLSVALNGKSVRVALSSAQHAVHLPASVPWPSESPPFSGTRAYAVTTRGFPIPSHATGYVANRRVTCTTTYALRRAGGRV